MKQYCFKDIYWFLDKNQSVALPFIFNNDNTKIKLLENESIIPLGLKQEAKKTCRFTNDIAGEKIAEHLNIELNKDCETIYGSTDLLFSKLYKKLLNPEGCDILKELSDELYFTNSTNQRKTVERFVNNKVVSYNDLKPIIYSLLDIKDKREIIEYTHNQTTKF